MNRQIFKTSKRDSVALWVAGWAVVFWLAGVAPAFGQHEESPLVIKDVIEQFAGNDVEGDARWMAEHKGVRYQFSSRANKEKFQANTKRYAAQMDGRCSRMGSMSGMGNGKLFVVHEQKLYLFASEGCRSGFIKDPENSLERDDSIYEFSRDQAQQGEKVLTRLIEAMGGEEVLDNLKGLRQTWSETVQRGDQEMTHRHTWQWSSDGTCWNLDAWDETQNVNLLAGEESSQLSDGERKPMYAAGRRELQRQANREWIVILQARDRDDFEVGWVYGKLVVAFDGTYSEMEIDQDTGLVNSIEYRGRGPSRYYGTIRKSLSDYRKVKGLNLPHRFSLQFDGESVDGSERSLEWIVNPTDKGYMETKGG